MKSFRISHFMLLSAALMFSFSVDAAVIEQVTESLNEARGREYAKSKGGSENNKLSAVGDSVRAGHVAFKHWVNVKGERSELTGQRTKIGGTYWYGWSMLLPGDFDHTGSKTIVMQLASWPTPRNGRFPCRANGPFMHVDAEGRLVFHLQHKGEDRDMVCDEFLLHDDVSKVKGKWLDFVMHTKWTGDANGFLSFWLKVDDNEYQQKIDYSGRTWWNDEDTGPYFKMGLYTGEPGWKGPESRYLYTDEYRLGDESATFNDVAPDAARRVLEASKGKAVYVTYYSTLNNQHIPIIIYTPPGYTEGETRYPVVYNLHGAGGGSPARRWDRVHETLVDAIENQGIRPVIYVFVNGLGSTFFVDYADSSKLIESSIVRELIPFIDKNYRTISTRSGRAVDGFSMGGFGALMLAFRNPELFSSVVSYGAALITADRIDSRRSSAFSSVEHFSLYDPRALARKRADVIRENLTIRMVCGEDDGLLDRNLVTKTLLDSLNIPVDWVPVPGVAHDTRGLYRKKGLESLMLIEGQFVDQQ